MECYIASEPQKRGYRKRLFAIWRSRHFLEASEQRLLAQVRQIKLKGWITEIEIEGMKRKHQERESGVKNNREEHHSSNAA